MNITVLRITDEKSKKRIGCYEKNHHHYSRPPISGQPKYQV